MAATDERTPLEIPADLPQKAIRAHVYRAGDREQYHAGTGVPADVDSVWVLVKDGYHAPVEGDIVVVVTQRPYLGHAPYASLLEHWRENWGMAGGTFIASSDSRFSEVAGIYGAVALHDRVES